MTLAEFVKDNHRFIAAHRGASETHPENTIAAFRAAIECGAAMVEADIQFTRDYVPIIYHDDCLGRTADGNELISQTNYDDLKNLSAGKWFDKSFNNEYIPTLEQLINAIRGKAYLGLEVKPNKAAFEQINIMVELLKKENFEKYTIFASFNYEALKQIKLIDERLHTAAIKIPNDNRLPSDLAEQFNIDSYICSVDELNNDITNNCVESNIVLGAYSIDSREQLEKALENNVRGIGTNNPCKISKYLAEF